MAAHKPEARERATVLLLDPLYRDQSNAAISRESGLGESGVSHQRAKLERAGVIPPRIPLDSTTLKHNKPVTRAAIVEFLKDPASHGRSARSVAGEFGVDHQTVIRVRKQLEDAGIIPVTLRLTNQHGGTRTAPEAP